MTTFPLAKSANNRYFVDSTGSPFPKLGRAYWGVVTENQTGYQSAIDDAVTKGFTSLEIGLIWWHSASSRCPFANNGALLPFLKRLDGSSWDGTVGSSSPDFTTPNDAYFNFVGGIIDYCATNGIQVEGFPAYIGYGGGGDQGWGNYINSNGSTRMATYGTWIATKFASKANLTWMMLGDTTPSGGLATGHDAMMSAINAVTRVSPYFSGENDSNQLSTNYAPLAALNSFNWGYSFNGDVAAQCRAGYSYSPTTPVQLGEEPYDEEGPDGNNANGAATQPVRRFQYWGWLSSIAGYCSGNGYLWPFNSGVWSSHINTTGAQDMARLNLLLKSIKWWMLVPDGLGGIGTLVTAGGGGGVSSADYVAAAASPDGTLLVAYLPPSHTGSATLDMTKMSGTCRARWFDPTNGTYASIGNLANTGTHAFTPTGNNSAGAADWILLLDIPSTVQGMRPMAHFGFDL